MEAICVCVCSFIFFVMPAISFYFVGVFHTLQFCNMLIWDFFEVFNIFADHAEKIPGES